jgi:hypothetical protein
MTKKGSKEVITFPLVCEKVNGHLCLTLSLKQHNDKFEDMHDGEDYLISNGCFVTQFALSLFCDNRHLIDGLMMDMTWRVLRLYITSILMVAICNVGIPAAVAFG